ncbi:MAG: hypothetical protein LUG89_01715 [Methanosphaera sp.]|nr:hypothetical protein [Methanosphaera sp.]
MYILYRVDEIKPKSILELGLGQTTLMTSRYSNYYDTKHVVIESNDEWIKSFSNKLNLSNTMIKQVDVEEFEYKDNINLRYHDLENQLCDKYDLVIVDGPQGFLNTKPVQFQKYPRSNMWNLIDMLADDFVIIYDDVDRSGDLNTAKRLEHMIRDNLDTNIYSTTFTGLKYQYVICSENNRFVTWF